MEEDKEINEKFEELVRKSQEESNKRQKKVDFGMLVIELILELIGFIIIINYLGWGVAGGLFLLFTGNNLQVIRTIKKNLEK
jgi:hypothetical protein